MNFVTPVFNLFLGEESEKDESVGNPNRNPPPVLTAIMAASLPFLGISSLCVAYGGVLPVLDSGRFRDRKQAFYSLFTQFSVVGSVAYR